MSIRKKLIGGFSVILLLLIISNTFSLCKILTMRNHAQEIEKRWLPSVVYTGGLNAAVNNISRLVCAYALEPNSSRKEEIKAELELKLQQLEKNINIYQKLINNPQEKENYQQFSMFWDEYLEQIPAIMEAGAKNDLASSSWLINCAQPALNNANQISSQMVDISRQGGKLAADNSFLSSQSATIWGMVFTLLTTLLGIILAVLIANHRR